MKREWLRFDPAGRSESGKTARWDVVTIGDGDTLGVVGWYASWRRYAFTPYPHTVFEEDCLRQIAEFCEKQTRDHKASSAKKGAGVFQ